MRPRLRVKEIGNEVRHGPNLQQMRLMDDLGRNTGKFYTIDDVAGQSDKNQRAMNEFIRTGQHSYVPGADMNPHESHHDLKEATKRRNTKINQTNYIVEPKEILSKLHQRTFYRGSAAIAQDVGAMKITTRMFNEEFLDA